MHSTSPSWSKPLSRSLGAVFNVSGDLASALGVSVTFTNWIGIFRKLRCPKVHIRWFVSRPGPGVFPSKVKIKYLMHEMTWMLCQNKNHQPWRKIFWLDSTHFLSRVFVLEKASYSNGLAQGSVSKSSIAEWNALSWECIDTHHKAQSYRISCSPQGKRRIWIWWVWDRSREWNESAPPCTVPISTSRSIALHFGALTAWANEHFLRSYSLKA